MILQTLHLQLFIVYGQIPNPNLIYTILTISFFIIVTLTYVAWRKYHSTANRAKKIDEDQELE
ncbi:sporulation protein YpjB [Halalkalibacillus sediminis]|uniref:sporulation protein YpjB n=1 Tax=Halalkalibacillus sediminis TaxID=2018042 RepID=UPI001390160B|nr:sporulation protein YpjB [Halalkalibacillus sediminis]